MRDPKRLDDFYDRMKKIHQENYLTGALVN